MPLRTNKPPQAWVFLMFRLVRSRRGVDPRIRAALRLVQGRRFAAARLVEDSAAVMLGSGAGTQVGEGFVTHSTNDVILHPSKLQDWFNTPWVDSCRSRHTAGTLHHAVAKRENLFESLEWWHSTGLMA